MFLKYNDLLKHYSLSWPNSKNVPNNNNKWQTTALFTVSFVAAVVVVVVVCSNASISLVGVIVNQIECLTCLSMLLSPW